MSVDQTSSRKEWLDWLTRVRLLLIALILATGVGLTLSRYFLPLIVFWITLGTIHIILLRWIPNARWHGGLQVISDVVMVSALVYATGLQDSYFISLYLLVIIVASILFSRRAAFGVATLSLLFLGGLTMLAYTGRIPRTYISPATADSLRFWLLSNLFGFLAIAYLASLLAQSLRRKGIELEEKREELLDSRTSPKTSSIPCAAV